jgi:hypothetical protein
MITVDLLERLASEASASHGIPIADARKLVRLAMVTVAVELGIPCERSVAYLQSVGTPATPQVSIEE